MKTIFVAILVFIFCIYTFDIYRVEGVSMEPTLYHGDMVVLEKILPTLGLYSRGDIVGVLNVREKRDDKKKMLLKRIVGLPGEAFYFSEDKTKFDFVVQDSFKNTYRLESDYSLTLDNMVNSENKKKILLGKDDYFVVGDNLGASEDSRVFGTVQPVEILGHAILTLPISSLRKGRFW